MQNIDQTRNYLIGEINLNQLMSKEYIKVCPTKNYIEDFIFASTILDVFPLLLLLL